MSGKVYLVGAGPGDPELLTLKALRLLQGADAVLYDELVSAEILRLLPRAAQLYNVGKRCGRKKISQTEINFLMVTLAASGRQVMRLKSGDPMVFGRLGEEVEALQKANIEYEIVPGVTAASGAAAAAGIPLTRRGTSSALVLLAGYSATGAEEADWRKLAASGATLVVYMPGHNYTSMAARLTQAGVRGETPCAIISRACTPGEKVHVTTVRELPRAPRLAAPTILVIGDVVRLAGQQSSPALPDFEQILLRAERAAELAS